MPDNEKNHSYIIKPVAKYSTGQVGFGRYDSSMVLFSPHTLSLQRKYPSHACQLCSANEVAVSPRQLLRIE
jgi:hypothetical protein